MTWCLFELEDNMTEGIFVKYEVTLNFKNEFEPCPQNEGSGSFKESFPKFPTVITDNFVWESPPPSGLLSWFIKMF